MILNFFKKILILGIFLINLGNFLWGQSNQEKKHSGYKQCIVSKISKKRNRVIGITYFSKKGKVYGAGKFLGEAKNGCLTIEKHLCQRNTIIKYFPNETKEYDFSLTYSSVNTCKDNYLIIKRSTYKRFSRFKWSIPYIKNIDLKSSFIKELAKKLTANCSLDDQTCYVYKIFRHVSTSLRYIPDGNNGGEDKIINPLDTIKRGGGDCEDLTGVLNSLLNALKVKNFVALSHNHAYSIACDIDPRKMQAYVNQGLVREKKVKKKLTLKEGWGKTISYQLKNSLAKDIVINLKSSHPINFYLIPRGSNDVLKNIVNEKQFRISDNCFEKETLSFNKICSTKNKEIIFAFHNSKKNSAKINLDFSFRYFPYRAGGPPLKYYKIAGQNCILLESTLDDGYPGYSNTTSYQSIAVNPKDWSWTILN